MFCQCSLGYITFGLHKHKLVQVFSQIHIPFLELINWGYIQKHPDEGGEPEVKESGVSPRRSLLPQPHVGVLLMQILITLTHIISA